jgi:hypothetical protein
MQRRFVCLFVCFSEEKPKKTEVRRRGFYLTPMSIVRQICPDDVREQRRMVAYVEMAGYRSGAPAYCVDLRNYLVHECEEGDDANEGGGGQRRKPRLSPKEAVALLNNIRVDEDYAAYYADVREDDRGAIDSLLGFLAILLSCIRHYRTKQRYAEPPLFSPYSRTNLDDLPVANHFFGLLLAEEKKKEYEIDNPEFLLVADPNDRDYYSLECVLSRLADLDDFQGEKKINQLRNRYRYVVENEEREDWKELNLGSLRYKDHHAVVRAFEERFLERESLPVPGLTNLQQLVFHHPHLVHQNPKGRDRC